jgi:hypothetical protein
VELITAVNENLPSSRDKIKMLDFEEARQVAIDAMKLKDQSYTFDPLDRMSDSLSTALTTDHQDKLSRVYTEKALKSQMSNMFVNVGSLMRTLNTKNVITDLLNGGLREAHPDRPHKALVQTKARVKRVIDTLEPFEVGTKIQEMPSEDFLSAGVLDRALLLFITREDERRLRFEDRFSLKVLKGSYRLPLIRQQQSFKSKRKHLQPRIAFGENSKSFKVSHGEFQELLQGERELGMNELAKPAIRSGVDAQAAQLLENYLVRIQKEEEEEARKEAAKSKAEPSTTVGSEPEHGLGTAATYMPQMGMMYQTVSRDVPVHEATGGPEVEEAAQNELTVAPTEVPIHAKPYKARWADMMDDDDECDFY